MTTAQRKLWSCSQKGNDSQRCGDQQSQTVSDVQQIQAHTRLKKTTTLPKQSGRVPRTQLQGEQFKQLPMRAQDSGNWHMLVSKNTLEEASMCTSCSCSVCSLCVYLVHSWNFQYSPLALDFGLCFVCFWICSCGFDLCCAISSFVALWWYWSCSKM